MGDSHRQPVADAAIPQLVGDANVSVDVDSLDCYRAIHGLPPGERGTPDPVVTTGIDRALQLFDECDLPATFFVVGRDLEVEQHCRRVERIADAGQEVANHSLDHRYDLRRLPDMELAHQIKGAHRRIAEVTGEEPVGFRTPGYNVDADVIAFCRRAGYRYDASVFPCPTYWLAKRAVMAWRSVRGMPSRSDATDPHNLLAPNEPYFPHPLDCWQPADSPSGFVEIPVAAFALGLIPVIGTSAHLLDTVGFHRLWPLIDAGFPRFFSFEMHAIDFVDATDIEHVADAAELVAHQPDLRIPWEKKDKRYRRIFEAIGGDRRPVTLAEATSRLA